MFQRMNPMQLMNAFRSAKNPQALLQQVMQNNPQLQQVMMQLQNSGGGSMTPEQMARQLAKQNGISDEHLTCSYYGVPNDILDCSDMFADRYWIAS